MPDYFLALIKQYCGAVGDDQAERYARSVTSAWYHSLPFEKRDRLIVALPMYIRPKSHLFFEKQRIKLKQPQYDLLSARVMVDLQKTDPAETEQILVGFFKSLKIISEAEQKYNYSTLLDPQLQSMLIEA